MQNQIDLAQYKLNKVVDGKETYLVNQGSLSPLAARKHQATMKSNKNSRKIVYTTPEGEIFAVLVSDRAFSLLSEMRDERWHEIKSFKSSEAETRKPVSELRQLGLIIGTKRKPYEYQLFGAIELYPLGLGIGIKSISETLPSLSMCVEIERAKAKAGIAKRMAKINKSVEFLEQVEYESKK